MTEGWRERGGRCSCRCISRAGPAPASSPPPAPAPPAHCQVQCQGHARASAAARRNAGAAGGGRRPASRQCLADDRETHRLAKFPHSCYNGSPDKHFRDTVDKLDNFEVARNHRQFADALGLIGFSFFQVTRDSDCMFGGVVSGIVPRRVGIPVNIMCDADALLEQRHLSNCNFSNKTFHAVSDIGHI